MSRRYIEVPYVEKDEAKALGAKWDPAQKSWYVPDNIDMHLFSRWIPDNENAWFYLVVGKRICWKCRQETSVVAFGIPYGEPYDMDEDDIMEGLYPAYDPSTYDALALIPRLGTAPKELRDYLEKHYHYKPAHSKTTNRTLLNNCCDHCGALQGEFFDFEEPSGAFVATSIRDIEQMQFYRIRTSGMLYGLLDSWSSADEALFAYAREHCEDLDLEICENIYLP